MGLALMFVGILIAAWGGVSYARAASNAERAEYERRYNDTYPGPM
jgi:hypothetical protein